MPTGAEVAARRSACRLCAAAATLWLLPAPTHAEREPIAVARARMPAASSGNAVHDDARDDDDALRGDALPDPDDPAGDPDGDASDAQPSVDDGDGDGDQRSGDDRASGDDGSDDDRPNGDDADAPEPATRRAPPAPGHGHDPARRARGASHSHDEPSRPARHATPPEPRALEHVVASGETLGGIAAHYGTSIESLMAENPGLEPDHIREGQQLTIGGDRRLERYTVQLGDTFTGIAHAFQVGRDELQRWNPKLDPDHIREGQTLSVYPHAPPSLSISVGSPSHGHLESGRRLRPGPGYAVREEDRAWGTDETVHDLIAGFANLHHAYPHTPRIWVHDLSLHRGGPIADHRSHQSGRDADIAYVQRSCDHGCGFHRLKPNDLDARRTWKLLRYWLERDALEAVFIDYRLQAPLYHAAVADGASREQLLRWFQYPRGRTDPGGVIRHFPKHDDHMHVRFACPQSDPDCVSFRPLLTHTASR